ncbi:MAG: hypothetical protein ACTSR7_07700 [Promethearchaeota archaeon]
MSSFKLKIILIGRDLVKNRLVQQIIKNRFAADYKLTVGVDILTKDVEFQLSEIATLSLWDIGHQQRFDFIRSTFYKGASGVILIFDLTREETFTEVRNYFTEITQVCGFRPFLLIGNNVNMLKQDEKMLFREKARAFAENEGGFYIETSPTGIDIVEDAISLLTRRIIDSRSRN